MSHFAVIVIGEDPEEQLAPYVEEVDEDSPYAEFNDETEEVKRTWEEGSHESVLLPSGEYVPAHRYADEDTRKRNNWPKGLTPKEYPNKVIWPTMKKFAKEYHGYKPLKIDGKTCYGYYHNPNAHWDWYVLGGRWTGYFKTKMGGKVGRPGLMTPHAKQGYVDQLLKGEIDIDGMYSDAYKRGLNGYKEAYDEIMDTLDKAALELSGVEQMYRVVFIEEKRKGRAVWIDDPFDKANKCPYKNPAGTREEAELFLEEAKKKWADAQLEIEVVTKAQLLDERLQSDLYWRGIQPDEWTGNFDKDSELHARRTQNNCLTPFACVKDGEWFEKGKMGWWGMVADEKDCEEWGRQFHELFEALPADTLISIFDCHI